MAYPCLVYEETLQISYATLQLFSQLSLVPRKAQQKDVYRRTTEIPQRTRISKANRCLKVHNAHLNLFILSTFGVH